jgi:tetratricopeptide (TPR) repeat protein
MSEAHRTDSAQAPEAAPGADRDAKIEQLLLVGLDHYFAGRYEHAINVWTRALFLDRSHARARAYIERARSALAEGQRESEELLQNGVAAFQRGDGGEARRLLRSAIDRGAPSEEALALLERLDRLDTTAHSISSRQLTRAFPAGTPVEVARAPRPFAVKAALAVASLALVAVAAIAAYAVASATRIDWRVLLELQDAPASTLAAPVARDIVPPPPRRGEVSLTRAKALAAAGHLRDALAALDGVRSTDPERADADRLRADIQRQLVALVSLPSTAPAREKADRPVP